MMVDAWLRSLSQLTNPHNLEFGSWLHFGIRNNHWVAVKSDKIEPKRHLNKHVLCEVKFS